MKRKFWTGLLAAWMVLSLTACGGAAKGGGAASADMAMPEAPMEAPMAEESVSYGGSLENESMADSGAPANRPTDGNHRLRDAKMILTGSMEVETTEFDGCAADLEALVDRLGGYLEYASVSSRGSGYRWGDYTVRVPAGEFETFRTRVGELCHVVYQDQGQKNISEAYYDTESRLTTQRTKLERLQTLLAKAESMEDIITIESAISETELTIEQLTGTLRHYDALVDFATITVSLREVYKLSNVEEPAESFGGRLGAAFADGWTAFVNGLEDFAVALAYGWMWVVLLAAAVVVVVRAVRKKKGTFHLPKLKQKRDQDKQ